MVLVAVEDHVGRSAVGTAVVVGEACADEHVGDAVAVDVTGRVAAVFRGVVARGGTVDAQVDIAAVAEVEFGETADADGGSRGRRRGRPGTGVAGVVEGPELDQGLAGGGDDR